LRRPAQLHRIRSRHGHDGFLLEHQQMAPLVRLMVA
jgi:homoserine acetyltransferase